MIVEFVDLQRQNKYLGKEILPVVNEVIKEADFSMGPKLERFEKQFAKFVGKKYCVGLNSGTDALFLTLLAYGIGPGDEVITAPNSYVSSAMVISNIGAVPKFVDINTDYHTIDASKIEKLITKKTKAIIPVHLYGQPAEMDPIIKISKKHNLFVIEDACQAHGAKYKGKTVPVGETGAFSFYPGKNLGAFGDGGAVVTDRKEISDKLLKLRNDGSIIKYHHESFGYKSRLDSIQAAVLSAKLKHLNEWNKKRNKHASRYTKLLENVPYVRTPKVLSDSISAFHLYVIEAEKRDSLQKFLRDKGIRTQIHYPVPIHLQKPYRKEGYRAGDYPVTEEKSKKILSLPMFPELTEKEIIYVVENIKKFYSNKSR